MEEGDAYMTEAELETWLRGQSGLNEFTGEGRQMLSECDGQEAKGSVWARLCHENSLYVGRAHDECLGNVDDRRSNRCPDTISMLADVVMCQSCY